MYKDILKANDRNTEKLEFLVVFTLISCLRVRYLTE